MGRALLKLIEATDGEVIFDGKSILPMSEKEFRPLRREMQMIFQDPYGSLNPRMNCGEIIREALEIHFRELSAADRRDSVAALLKQVGLEPEMAGRYPHEFSGGQRQRIGIARRWRSSRVSSFATSRSALSMSASKDRSSIS